MTMIAFNTQASNPYKHELMPIDYPFHIYEITDDMVERLISEGYQVMTPDDFNIYKNSFDLTAYNADIAPTVDQIIQAKIDDAVIFGKEIMDAFKRENILMGITQAGKTKLVQDYLHRVEHYVNSGSLYAGKEEVISIINSNAIPTNLAPFVTVARLTVFVNKILTYLGLPTI